MEAERDSSSLGNALVDAVERRFSAEIDGIGAIQEGLSEGAIKLEFCPFDWEPPVTRELADMPKGVVRLALPEGDVPVPGGFWLLPTSNQPLLKTTAWSLSCR